MSVPSHVLTKIFSKIFAEDGLLHNLFYYNVLQCSCLPKTMESSLLYVRQNKLEDIPAEIEFITDHHHSVLLVKSYGNLVVTNGVAASFFFFFIYKSDVG